MSLVDIPIEVLDIVFSFLDPFELISRVSRTCKWFQELVFSGRLYSLRKVTYRPSAALNQIPTRRGGKGGALTDEIVYELASMGKGRMTQCRIGAAVFSDSSSADRITLSDRSISDKVIHFLLKNCFEIQELVLESIKFIEDSRTLFELMSGLKNLQKLSLKRCSIVTDNSNRKKEKIVFPKVHDLLLDVEGLKTFGQFPLHFPSLKSLTINKFDDLPKDSNSIKQMTIYDCQKVDLSDIPESVTELTMSYSKLVGSKMFPTIDKVLPQLTKFHYYFRIEDVNSSSIFPEPTRSPCRVMEDLKLSLGDACTDDVFVRICQKFPNLKSLCIFGSKKLTDKGVIAGCSLLPSLETLKLPSCGNIVNANFLDRVEILFDGKCENLKFVEVPGRNIDASLLSMPIFSEDGYDGRNRLKKFRMIGCSFRTVNVLSVSSKYLSGALEISNGPSVDEVKRKMKAEEEEQTILCGCGSDVLIGEFHRSHWKECSHGRILKKKMGERYEVICGQCKMSMMHEIGKNGEFRKHLEMHEENLPSRTVPQGWSCVLPGCDAHRLNSKNAEMELSVHLMTECKENVVRCPGCSEFIPYFALEKHREECSRNDSKSAFFKGDLSKKGQQ